MQSESVIDSDKYFGNKSPDRRHDVCHNLRWGAIAYRVSALKHTRPSCCRESDTKLTRHIAIDSFKILQSRVEMKDCLA